jgi:hypothetical protein
MPRFNRAIFLAALCASADAGALSYACDTEKGSIRADQPPKECKDKEIRVLNSDGSLNRVLPAPITAEESARREAKRQAEAAEARKKESEANEDRALLARYADENAIDLAKKRDLQASDEILKLADAQLAYMRTQAHRLAEDAEFYSGRPLPEDLRSNMESNRSMVEQQQRFIEQLKAERSRIEASYQAKLARFRQLRK